MKKIRCIFFGFVIALLFSKSNCFGQKQGQARIDSLLQKLKKNDKDDTAKVNLLVTIGIEYEFLIPDSAAFYYNFGLSLAKKIKWLKGQGISLDYLGLLEDDKGNLPQAISIFQEELQVWNRALLDMPPADNRYKNLLKRKAVCIGNIGLMYYEEGDFDDALKNYQQSLRIGNELNDSNRISIQLGNIGLVYNGKAGISFARNDSNQAIKDFKKAFVYYSQALKIDKARNNLAGVSRHLSNMGIVYKALGYKDSALMLYRQANDIEIKLKSKIGQIYKLGSIGSLYSDLKIYDSALFYLNKALALSIEIGNKYNEAFSHDKLGILFFKLKNLQAAEQHFLNAISLSRSIHSFDILHESLNNISEVYQKMGNNKKALDYYQKAVTIKDSLFNEEKVTEINKQEMQYEFDRRQDSIKAEQSKKDAIAKKELEKQKLLRNSLLAGTGALLLIGLLGFVNFRNKRRRESAEYSLKILDIDSKVFRSQMNSHFHYNALQSILTFLKGHRTEEAEKYLLEFSTLMRLVVENSQHQEVHIEKDLKALQLYMNLESLRLKYPFTYKFHVDPAINPGYDTIPPLILQPFVENAIWHGLQPKPGPGHIDIYLTKKGDLLYAIVEDNGVGRDMSKTVEQPMKKEHLGMKLTEDRLKILSETKKMKTTVSVTDLFTAENKPAGTKIDLTLPL